MIPPLSNRMIRRHERTKAPPPDAARARCPICGAVGQPVVRDGRQVIEGCRCRRPSEGRDPA